MSEQQRGVICYVEIDVEAARAAGALVLVTDRAVLIAPASAPEPDNADLRPPAFRRGAWDTAGWQQIGAIDDGTEVPAGLRRHHARTGLPQITLSEVP